MQYCGSRMFAQCIQYGCERQLATVPSAKPPTHNLPGFQVKDHGEIMLLAHKPEMREVLYPRAGMHHSGIALACLRTLLVTEHGEVLQSVRRGSYLCWRRVTAPLLAWPGNGDTSKRTDTPSFSLAPTKVEGEPFYTVKRMLEVCLLQYADCLLIPFAEDDWLLVVAAAGDPKFGYEVSLPSWVDLVQDG